MATSASAPAEYAEVLRTNPSMRDQVLAGLHQTRGNAFVQAVLAEVDRGESRRTIPAAGKGGGSVLPTETRVRMERSFGADLSAVRVHEDAEAAASNAEAYTRGTDIHFAPGRYDPSSTRGLELLGHELSHVVQQAQGRVAPTDQHKGGGLNDDAGLEHEADELGGKAARGGAAAATATGQLGTASPVVQRKVTVASVPAVRKAKLEVLGDNTPANPGLKIDALQDYTTAQADWFTDPSFTAADREAVWKVVNLFQFGGHVAPALAKLHTGEVAALPNRAVLKSYFDGFDSSIDTIQLATPAATLARALQVGTALTELATFVPGAVLRHVIPESGLDFLITKTKLAELKSYYTTFKPSLEKPQEWAHIETLLIETIARWGGLVGWISELHIFTPSTRATLLKNIGNKSKLKPVMLIVMSALDWNTAFLQSSSLDGNLADGHNLGLVIQGRTLAALTGQVAAVARDYGKGGKLGQVVLAGHGSDTSMEMASDSTKASWDPNNDRVAYDGQADLDSKVQPSKDPKKASDPKKNGTEALIDTILASMDPATANLVFAGCLINSHDVDPKTSKLTGKDADVEKALRANVAAHPNLADYVKSRMAATGHNAQMSAANASTTFATFNLDGTGKAQLVDKGDPAIGGTKHEYLKTGIEPEGVLRAALECCSDPALGIAPTTAAIRTRLAAPAGAGQWAACIRVAFQLALPAVGNVNVSMLADLVHRIGEWGEFNSAVTAQRLADKVQKPEATPVFSAMIGAGPGDAMVAGIHQAWMKFDPSHATQMMTALTTSGFTSEDFAKQLSRGLVASHLATMLPIVGAPTRGQMILALTIANQDGEGMPAAVRDFLRHAAGGAASRSFPVGLDVNGILPNGAPRVLQAIGLSAKSPPPTSGTVDGNVDLDGDGKNETLITVAPHQMTVGTDNLMVRASATSSAPELGKLAQGTVVRVAGSTRNGTWSMIDFNGRAGFVSTQYLKS